MLYLIVKQMLVEWAPAAGYCGLMGHLILLFLHAIALVFFPLALFVTLPLHLIYSASGSGRTRDPEAPHPDTHVRCPACRELVRKDAKICKHCGVGLIPQP